MAEYNGHRSWNAWNISLWINNDESTWRYCADLVRRHGIERAARIYAREMEGQRTPDGGRYNYTCIREAFRGLAE